VSDHAVASLYDALQEFESPLKRGQPYPVHKTLRIENLGAGDIYDWIAARLEGQHPRHVLDAGCGVGDGAIRLAEKLSCRVTGVSVSEREVAAAGAAARQLGIADRLDFRLATFDHLPPATYDAVIAVESLKHSRDLATSLRSLVGSLKRGGVLVIVEDLHGSADASAPARRLIAEWELARLYSERDYLDPLSAEGCRCSVVDLSACVRRVRPAMIAFKRCCLHVATPFVGASRRWAIRAFLGGLYLDHLYARDAVAYKAILCTKGSEA
jgi:SAM-dependent methyltransferase